MFIVPILLSSKRDDFQVTFSLLDPRAAPLEIVQARWQICAPRALEGAPASRGRRPGRAIPGPYPRGVTVPLGG
jgi:hypothetical protein